jgi:DUF2934 family protein
MRTESFAWTPARTSCPTHVEIATLAYELYKARGRDDGHDVDDWLEAEQLLQPTPTDLVFGLYERAAA